MTAWRMWVALWDRREDAAALALVRIFVGLVLVADAADLARFGLVEAVYTTSPTGFAVMAGSGPTLWLVAFVAAACIATGTLTRVACVVFVLASAQLGHISPHAERGIDSLLRVVVAILALSQSHARWSVDAAVGARLGRAFRRDVPAWPRYLLLLQLVWVYASGGMNKGGEAWFPHGGFTALANVLADPHVARFDPSWISPVMPLTRVATALTIAFELGAPFYLVGYYAAATRLRGGKLRAVFVYVRYAWLAMALAFELGIAIGMRLGIFPWGMLALFPVLLLPVELQRRKIDVPANRASSPS